MNSKIKIFVIISSLLLFPFTSIMAQDVSLNFTRIQYTYTQATEKVRQLEEKLALALLSKDYADGKADADAKAVQSKKVVVTSYQVGGSNEEKPKTENLHQENAKVILQLQKELAVAKKEKEDADVALRKAKEEIKLNSAKK